MSCPGPGPRSCSPHSAARRSFPPTRSSTRTTATSRQSSVFSCSPASTCWCSTLSSARRSRAGERESPARSRLRCGSAWSRSGAGLVSQCTQLLYPEKMKFAALLAVLFALLSVCAWGADPAKEKPVINPPPTAKDWADLAKLPDWSGVWNPKITDQDRQVRSNPPPWNPQAAALVAHQSAEEKAGRPAPLFVNCLPEAMPAWMLITHNAMEILFTPGRVTMLGESDGNRLRRIYTDGRPHPEDPDPTFHGHSIGHWEGETLVVDTVGVMPQTYIAIGEGVGVPNNGDMHIKERIYLAAKDILHV